MLLIVHLGLYSSRVELWAIGFVFGGHGIMRRCCLLPGSALDFQHGWVSGQALRLTQGQATVAAQALDPTTSTRI